MSKKFALCLALVGLLGLGGQAVAEIGTIDDVPAATLLLPYFEVDLTSTSGINTLFSINNASNAAALAHITVWTDLSVPVLDFDVYLTGYDVQTISMRDILNGILPQTQTEPGDPGDAVSPNGADTLTVLGDPEDPAGVFLGITGPCVGTYGPLGSPFIDGHLIPALTGGPSSISSCVGSNYGDNIARGYVTVDTAVRCSLDFPSTGGYFTGGGATAGFANNLWGDYFYVEPGQNFAQGETLVHIEACNPGTTAPGDGFYDGWVGNGAGYCEFGFGDFTFYSRYVGNTGDDQREALASQFAVRYATGSGFDGGTDYIVWRDSRSNDIVGGPCPAENDFAWYPLNQDLVVAFDEEENSEELCILESDVSPPTPGIQTCFPIEAGRYNVELSEVPNSRSLDPSFALGWMYLDLDLTSSVESQAWVTAVMSAEGRYSVGFDAIQLDNASEVPLFIP